MVLKMVLLRSLTERTDPITLLRWNQDELQLINGTELSLGDDQKIKVGTGDDLQLYHASGNSYISNTTGSLYIRGANGNLEGYNVHLVKTVLLLINGSVDTLLR